MSNSLKPGKETKIGCLLRQLEAKMLLIKETKPKPSKRIQNSKSISVLKTYVPAHNQIQIPIDISIPSIRNGTTTRDSQLHLDSIDQSPKKSKVKSGRSGFTSRLIDKLERSRSSTYSTPLSGRHSSRPKHKKSFNGELNDPPPFATLRESHTNKNLKQKSGASSQANSNRSFKVVNHFNLQFGNQEMLNQDQIQNLELTLNLKKAEASYLKIKLEDAKLLIEKKEKDNNRMKKKFDELLFELTQSKEKNNYYRRAVEIKNEEIIRLSNSLNQVKNRLSKLENEKKANNQLQSQGMAGITPGAIQVIKEASVEGESEDECEESKWNKGLRKIKHELVELFSSKTSVLSNGQILELAKKFAETSEVQASSDLKKLNHGGLQAQESISLRTANGITSSAPSELLKPLPSAGHSKHLPTFDIASSGLQSNSGMSSEMVQESANRLEDEGDSSNGSTSGILELLRLVIEVTRQKYEENKSLVDAAEHSLSRLKHYKFKVSDYRNKIIIAQQTIKKYKKVMTSFSLSESKSLNVSATRSRIHLRRHDDLKDENEACEEHEEGGEEETMFDAYVDEFNLKSFRGDDSFDEDNLLYK